MRILTFDTETTTSNKGHFADRNNKLIVTGTKWLGESTVCNYNLQSVKEIINQADMLVGFNIKFDLHWLDNVGIDTTNKQIWDCQIAEFLLESQLNTYNSLNDACRKYGLEEKIDVVKTEYWDKGIDTDQIPRDILNEYLAKDCELTEQVFLRQREEFKTRHPNLLKLFKLECRDLVVLKEIERAGLRFDTDGARAEAAELEGKMATMVNTIIDIVGNIPFNLNSNDHLSAILYGGTITETVREPAGVFKTGARVGQIKFKNVDVEHKLPRLVNPLKNTETSKSRKLREKGETQEETTWEVNTDTLKQLKATGKAKKILDVLFEYSAMEKLRNTYLLGWSDLIDKMNWPKDMIHGNLNQTSVVTGRLSSTKPNMQNVDKQTKRYIVSRYANQH